jgi:hypothetical protein
MVIPIMSPTAPMTLKMKVILDTALATRMDSTATTMIELLFGIAASRFRIEEFPTMADIELLVELLAMVCGVVIEGVCESVLS